MKITSILSLATATGLLAIATISPAEAKDRNFAPPTNSTKIKTKANFYGSSGKMALCPSGDCEKGQLVTLSLGRLEEIDPATNTTVQSAKNFAALSASWGDFEDVTINGVSASTTSFVTDVPVKRESTEFTAKFNLTATIYSANGTALNGKQVVPVPAGALKFTITITDWKFADEKNLLNFGVMLSARGKDAKERGKPTKKAKTGGNSTQIDRLDMGEGMFMDTPSIAVLDGVEQNITSSIEGDAKKIELVWSFPSFKTSLFYDPVTGSEDATATGGTSGTTDSTTSGASSLFTVFSGAAVAALTALLAF